MGDAAPEDLTLRVEDGSGRRVDVLVGAGPDHTVDELAVALGGFLGRTDRIRLARRDGDGTFVFDPAATIGSCGLVSGATVVIVSDGPPVDPGPVPIAEVPVSGRYVDVIGGPDSGRSHRLDGPGRYLVGRDAAATIRVDDPSVSRRHAVLVVDDAGQVVAHPVRGATNGLRIGGVHVDGPTALADDQVVRLGATRIVVREVTIADRRTRPSGRGPDVDVRPGPYRRPQVEAPDLEPFGPVPERHAGRRLPVVSIVAPLVLGVVMFAVFGHVQFLVLVLVSPVLMIASVVEDRRSGRRDQRRRVEEFETELARYCERLGDIRERERRVRDAAAPDLAVLIRRATTRSPALWERRSTGSDMLVVRIGVGTLPTAQRIEIARGGADDLRERAESAVVGLDVVEAPVTLDLRDQEVVVVTGPSGVVDGLVGSVLAQVAVLAGPDEVAVAAAVHPDRPHDWLDWLPHVRRPWAASAACAVVRCASEVPALFDRVLDAAGRPAGTARSVVVVVDGSLEIDGATVARFLDAVPGSGVVVVWIASDGADVPRQARTVVSTGVSSDGEPWAGVWSVERGAGERRFEPETVRSDLADRLARTLAPLRDVSGIGRTSAVPGTVDLFDLLDVDGSDPDGLGAEILRRWERSRHGAATGLQVPIGLGAQGRVGLDLVVDGPHALVAGTSGSGKSEFLQSLVVSLAVHHPPERVNVLLVDFKGGAMSDVVGALPHSVGTVSNLTPGLAHRVLVSLRAELERRMALLHGRAADLGELTRIDPDAAPPSLVVIVDEFATLINELPEFVPGVIDIAQRGRSLGIHLVLATQRPSGAVTDDILANTGVRIGLRMLDPVESTTVLGTPAAATLGRSGRALVRCGVGRPIEFQSAHAGAPASVGARPIEVRPLRDGRRTADETTPSPGVDTQLRRVVDAIVDAADRCDRRPSFRPWCDPLPEVLDLGPLLELPLPADSSGWPVVIGVLDEPAQQRQRRAVVDLDRGLLVVGAKGVGATTLVRTLAASLGVGGALGGVVGEVLVFDGRSSGLADLESFPGVTAVVPARDLEGLTRWIVALETELGRRRRSSERRRRSAAERVVVVLHGFEGVVASLLDGPGGHRSGPGGGGEAWVERLVRVVVDGGDVGIAAVVTATRRGEVPGRVESAIATRLVFRTAEPSAWIDHGLTARDTHDLVPGRGHLIGIDGGPVLVHVARVDPSCSRLAATTGSDVRPTFVRSRRLPDLPAPVEWGCRGRHDAPPYSVVLGVADVSGDVVSVDLECSDLVVSGPPGSGRSTALAVVAAQLADGVARVGRPPVRLIGATGGALAELCERPGVWNPAGLESASLESAGLESASLESAGLESAGIVVVDDADRLDPDLLDAGALAARRDVRLVAAVESGSMSGFHSSPLIARLRRARRVLVLGPDDPTEFLQTTGVRWPIRPGLALPPGRGVLVADRTPVVLHVGAAPITGHRASLQSDR